MICPEYYRTIDILMGISTGRPYTSLDLTEVDIVEFLISGLYECTRAALQTHAPKTFYEFSETREERADAQFEWDRQCYYILAQVVADVEDSMTEVLDRLFDINNCWDYMTLVDQLLAWSDLSKKDSPILQFYHKLIKERDSNDHSSFAIPYVFGEFVNDLTNQLTDAGYFGTGIPRVSLKDIPWKYKIPF